MSRTSFVRHTVRERSRSAVARSFVERGFVARGFIARACIARAFGNRALPVRALTDRALADRALTDRAFAARTFAYHSLVNRALAAAACLCAAIALLGPGGCASPDSARNEGTVVVASIHPIGALLREIASPEATVQVLLPPGASPHSYEPSPREVAGASRAAIVVRIGAGLDDWVRPLTREAVERGATELLAIDIVGDARGVDLIAGDRHTHDGHAHDGHDAPPARVQEAHGPPGAGSASGPGSEPESESGSESGSEPGSRHGSGQRSDTGSSPESESRDVAEAPHIDPHIWLDPVAMIPLCEAAGAALAQADPANAAAYRSRTAACVDSLRALDRSLAALLQPYEGAAFVSAHGAWGYLGRRYGLVQADVVQPAPNRDPGPRRLVEIIERAREAGARAVFTEVQVSDASAQTVAEEGGLGIARLDPLGDPDDPQRDRYFDLMRWNARRIAEALAPPRTAGRDGS